jgi:glycine/D-amino acid oxidase-like deaminating enzyme
MTPTSGEFLMTAAKNIIVVGAGIIGASIAWHLTRAGAAVTIIEAGEGGGVATPASFAWINASWGNPGPYFRLRTRSMAEWSRLAAEVPGIALGWGGGLCWDLPPDKLRAYAAEHGAWGYGIRLVDRAEAKRIEPNLAEPPELAVHVANEGAVEPAEAARAIVADAVRRGAGLIQQTEVRSLIVEGGAVRGVDTAKGAFEADETVIATGAATPALAATAGIRVPLEASPGLIIRSQPTPERLLNGLVIAGGLDIRQTPDGRIVASASFAGGDPGPDAAATAQALFERTCRALVIGSRLDFGRYIVGYRPMPADGFPIVGRAPGMQGLYLAVTHSGVTLAPAVGVFAAAELLGEGHEPFLEPYRLARFA